MPSPIDALLRPRSIAIVGASADFQKLNGRTLKEVGIPDAALGEMREHGIPVLRGAEPAIDAIAALVRYAETRRHRMDDRQHRDALALPKLELPVGGGPVSSMARLAELDLNPVLCSVQGVAAVDWMMVLGEP